MMCATAAPQSTMIHFTVVFASIVLAWRNRRPTASRTLAADALVWRTFPGDDHALEQRSVLGIKHLSCAHDASSGRGGALQFGHLFGLGALGFLMMMGVMQCFASMG
jgi:hypothetical protein